MTKGRSFMESIPEIKGHETMVLYNVPAKDTLKMFTMLGNNTVKAVVRVSFLRTKEYKGRTDSNSPTDPNEAIRKRMNPVRERGRKQIKMKEFAKTRN